MTTNGTEERPLPDGWTWANGGSLFKWASGKNLSQKTMGEGSIPVFGGNGIGGFHDEYLVEYPTLVIGRVGAHCGNVHITKGKSWITDNAIYAKEISEGISLKFAQIAFQLAKLNEKATGSGQPFVNQRTLNEVKFPLPPFHEQESIVAEIEKQFTRLDQAVASLRRLQGSLAERRAQWQAANPGKKYKEVERVGEDTAVLPDLPDGWVRATWKQLSPRVTVGHVGSMKDEYVDEGVPFLRSQNVRENRYDPEGLKFISPAFDEKLSKSQLKPGDIVVVRSGSVMEPEWTLPSRMDSNPMAWFIMFNGLVMDARSLPRHLQEEAYRKGLIPYIPADQE